MKDTVIFKSQIPLKNGMRSYIQWGLTFPLNSTALNEGEQGPGFSLHFEEGVKATIELNIFIIQ